MKWLNGHRMRTVWLAMVFITVLGAGGRARAEIITGEPVNLGAVINDATDVQECDFSHDGLELYYASGRPGGYGGWDLWVSKRETPGSPWQEPVNLGPAVNGAGPDIEPSISGDGLELYFASTADPYTRVCRRPSKDAPWGSPAILTELGDAWRPDISADGLSLYFSSTRAGGNGGSDIWVATRATIHDNWGEPVNLGSNVNSAREENSPSISTDGLTLVFTRGYNSLWATTRESQDDEWGPAVDLRLNKPGPFNGPALSPDGSALYLDASAGWGGFGDMDLWQVPIIPIVDFNGDEKVDIQDLGRLIESWGKNDPSVDIGPVPWGDGVVDEKDLKVLMESLMTPRPQATGVLCDVILSWISPSFALACDVYLGTSFEAVNTATRSDPQGVLVSQGQTASTYVPALLLEFSRTYYWRVDFVVPGPTPTICQGPVVSFTTEASAYPIKNVTAKASSSQAGMDPQRTVDGSGLDKNDGHSTASEAMWRSEVAGPQPTWIQFEFDKVYRLHEMWVWNHNAAIEAVLGYGFKAVAVQYSTNGEDWTTLADVEFAAASGREGYTHNTTVSLGDMPAKFVKLTAKSNWSSLGLRQYGLSEVRFFCIQTAPAAKP